MGLFTDGFKLLKKASEPLYKTPKSIQETIEIMAVAENGIFEVNKNKYSKCYRFQDINYTTATEDEQIGIFERYCKFLNSLDCNYKITINNKNKNMDELRDKVLIAEKNDGFNNYRRIYNDIIEEKIIEGRQGIEQERYLTITIERKNFEEAKAQFATLEATIHKAFIELGAEIVPLNGNERLKVLYDYYHLGDEGSFDFDIKKAKKVARRHPCQNRIPGCSAVGSAPALGAGCREFESPHSDHTWTSAWRTSWRPPFFESAPVKSGVALFFAPVYPFAH